MGKKLIYKQNYFECLTDFFITSFGTRTYTRFNFTIKKRLNNTSLIGLSVVITNKTNTWHNKKHQVSGVRKRAKKKQKDWTTVEKRKAERSKRESDEVRKLYKPR